VLFTVDVADTADVRHHRAAFARVAATATDLALTPSSQAPPVELPPFQLQVRLG